MNDLSIRSLGYGQACLGWSLVLLVDDTPDTTYYIKDFFDHKDKETKPIAVTQYDCIMHFIMLYMCTNRRNFYKIQKSRKR